MNPGYDRADYQGSTRVIHYECMFCHNGYPRVPAGHQESGAEAQYVQPLPEGIDCQRCHGPGQRHIETAGRTGAPKAEIRAAIVNPARLAPEREMEVCMQCHLETSSRLLPHSLQRMGRGPFSYIPGQPLADFRLAFDRAPGQNQDFEVAQHAYRLRASQCFLKTGGKLRCTTCHNPHDIPRGESAASGYNRVCQGCHTSTPEPKADHIAGANCVQCHMPRRRTDDAVHIVLTEHRIGRPSRDNLLAEKNEKHESPASSYRGPVVPYYPSAPTTSLDDQLDIALAQVTDRSNLESGLPQLAALIAKYHPAGAGYYSGIAEAYRAQGELSKAIPYYEEAARRAPSSEIIQLQLGNALMESRQWTKAEAALRRAKALRPDDAAAWGLLGWILWQQDKKLEARTSLETAIRLDPDFPGLRNYLASLLIGSGDPAGAEREFRAAIRIDPGVAEWRVNLAKLLAARSSMGEAAYQAKAAVRDDPGLAEGHELWGRLLSAASDFSGAARELQAAIRLRPDSPLAHYELGVVFLQLRNPAGAIEQLRLAAQSSDPQAKAAAQEMLRRMGQ
jgi:predicted CXXCH cytochrome family protein